MTDRPSRGDRTDLVTGAFGNAGSAIASELGSRGVSVRTLTGRPGDGPPGSGIEALPFRWGEPDALAEAFSGVRTFYNTYWMRLGDGSGSYDTAVDRCIQLIDAAVSAGVERIVHLSVAHPSLDSPYPYFRGKARVEQHLQRSEVPHAIVRPALVFGGDSVLLDNLAWILRRAPVFALAGDGRYRVRPVHVDDLARACVGAGERPTVEVFDAVGPDRPTYAELVGWVRDAIGSRTLVVPAPLPLVLLASRVLGFVVRDDILDRDELVSTMEGLADSDGPSIGPTSVREWLQAEAGGLGRRYVGERRRRS